MVKAEGNISDLLIILAIKKIKINSDKSRKHLLIIAENISFLIMVQGILFIKILCFSNVVNEVTVFTNKLKII